MSKLACFFGVHNSETVLIGNRPVYVWDPYFEDRPGYPQYYKHVYQSTCKDCGKVKVRTYKS